LLAAGSITGEVGIVLGANYGSIYTSSDYGASWVLANAPSGDWIGIVSSFDGRNLTAIDEATGVYRSGDFGQTWHIVFDSNYTWQGIASDLSLDYVYATTDGEGKCHFCDLQLLVFLQIILITLLFSLYHIYTNRNLQNYERYYYAESISYYTTIYATILY
jgi:hypothetical protein